MKATRSCTQEIADFWRWREAPQVLNAPFDAPEMWLAYQGEDLRDKVIVRKN
jgi:hypothetical protein